MGRERVAKTVVLYGTEETIQFGCEVAKHLNAGQVLALVGDLGAGKTTLVQGLLQGLNIQDTAQSPTFTILQTYGESLRLNHFDLYRIETEDEFIRLGFHELLQDDGIAVIEWPDRISSLIPPEALLIELSHCGANSRKALLSHWGER